MANHYRRALRGVIVVAVAIGVAAGAPDAAGQGSNGPSLAAGGHWVGTWAATLVARAAVPPPAAAAPLTPPGAGAGQPVPPPPLNFNNQTLRQIVRVSVGGADVRAVFSNAFGTAPLRVGAASIALREKNDAIVSGSSRPLLFSGKPSAAIAPGAVLVSDPVTLRVADLADVAVDLYLPGDTAAAGSPLAHHTGNGAVQTNYVSDTGNHAGAQTLPVRTTTRLWHFLSRVEVTAPAEVGAVVALGDSITAGSQSTLDTNNRWPNHLARRLLAQNIRMGVLNAGHSGNRLLSDGNGQSALARFDRDVAAQTAATHLVVLIGINDVARATADDLIAGHRQIIARARARGLKVYAATLTPFEGSANWAPEQEATRQALNRWLRTSREYDGVFDFEAAVRDPAHPTKMLQKFAAADNLHPNDAGYEALANAVDLSVFGSSPRPAGATASAAAALKTPWGEPDLQGIWSGQTATPLQRPERWAGKSELTPAEADDYVTELLGRPGRDRRAARGTEQDVAGAYNAVWENRATRLAGLRTSLIVDPPDGRIPPLTDAAKRRQAETSDYLQALLQGTSGGRPGPISPRRNEPPPSYNLERMNRSDGPEDRSNSERCFGATLPNLGGIYRIVQSPGQVGIYHDSGQGQGFMRVIPIDDRPALPSRIRLLHGDARGRWEGDTLVAETANFTYKMEYQGSRENLRLIERFRRVAENEIEYRVTVEDPTTWTKPWTVAVPWEQLPDRLNQVYESTCHEGNYGLLGMLANTRAAERLFREGRGPDPARQDNATGGGGN
jgi:lysophospholipase L1-like esterase